MTRTPSGLSEAIATPIFAMKLAIRMKGKKKARAPSAAGRAFASRLSGGRQ
jgi:hypothetical protein